MCSDLGQLVCYKLCSVDGAHGLGCLIFFFFGNISIKRTSVHPLFWFNLKEQYWFFPAGLQFFRGNQIFNHLKNLFEIQQKKTYTHTHPPTRVAPSYNYMSLLSLAMFAGRLMIPREMIYSAQMRQLVTRNNNNNNTRSETDRPMVALFIQN